VLEESAQALLAKDLLGPSGCLRSKGFVTLGERYIADALVWTNLVVPSLGEFMHEVAKMAFAENNASSHESVGEFRFG